MGKNSLQNFVLIIIAALGLQSCEEGITLTLPLDTPSMDITIPVIPTTGEFTVGPIPFEINIDSIAAANDIEKSDITSVKVKTVTYTMISPVDANFNLIENLANYASTDVLPEIRFAYINNIPNDGLNKLSLTADDVELRDYFLNNFMQLTLRGRNDVPISNPMEIRLDMTLEAKVKVLE